MVTQSEPLAYLITYFLYRRAFPEPRARARFSLYVATGLPIIVAVTAIEVSAGAMSSQDAAALVGAGALTVLIFPLLGNALVKGRPGDETEDQERAAKVV